MTPDPAALETARTLLRDAGTGYLATLLSDGRPYVSLVNLTTSGSGMPLFLLSRLALHTRNLEADRRASLLLVQERDQTIENHDDRLAGTRVTLIGTVAPCTGSDLRTRFIGAHPEAETYVDFADFSFHVMEIERAHLIGGFGRIVDLPGFSLNDPSAD